MLSSCNAEYYVMWRAPEEVLTLRSPSTCLVPNGPAPTMLPGAKLPHDEREERLEMLLQMRRKRIFQSPMLVERNEILPLMAYKGIFRIQWRRVEQLAYRLERAFRISLEQRAPSRFDYIKK